jgi:hypothetical protein
MSQPQLLKNLLITIMPAWFYYFIKYSIQCVLIDKGSLFNKLEMWFYKFTATNKIKPKLVYSFSLSSRINLQYDIEYKINPIDCFSHNRTFQIWV